MPARFESDIARAARGPAVVLPLVEMGEVIEATQSLTGSAPVLSRMAAGDPSAYSELRVARFLTDRGLAIELEPELMGRKPDFRIIAPALIYGEVVTPQYSQTMTQLQAAMAEAADILVHNIPFGHHLEFAISSDINPISIARHLVSVGFASDPGVHVVEVAQARAKYVLTKIDPALEQQLGNTIAVPTPALFIVSSRFNDAGSQTVLCRQSVTDERAGRILEAESKHFTRDQPNIVIMDTGGTPFGEKTWTVPVERRFQPGVNTRFSSVGFFRRSLWIGSGDYRSQWSMTLNPHALHPLPQDVLELLRGEENQ